jgi:hypothetical protein
MLSSRAFNLLREVILKSEIIVNDANYEQELQDIAHPYVLCVHRPSRRAFILNRRYLHITDVSQCAPPETWAERAIFHLCASVEIPDWALNCDHSEFDSYWLY